MMPREYYLRDLSSAREMFVAAGVGTFQAVLRNIMDTFILKCIFKVTMSDSKVFMAQSRGSADDYKWPVTANETISEKTAIFI